MARFIRLMFCLTILAACNFQVASAEKPDREQIVQTINRAIDFYHSKVASHGGYVYYYTLDMKERWGEGRANDHQIWIEPPGTPTVGMAFLKAHQATGNQKHLTAALDACIALVKGQLKSGGWLNHIDFTPDKNSKAYKTYQKVAKRNNSTLDDGKTQSALRLLIQFDERTKFQDEKIHQTALKALDALLGAQFPNGGFPQVWQKPSANHKPVKAQYPDYDWRTENRVKEYWLYYTLNDDVAGYVLDTLLEADRVYETDRYRKAILKLGDFLIDAQMPDPQPGWAQQYNFEMIPVWARKFEPPAVAGDETQEVISSLMKIAQFSGDKKYLKPIPKAIEYLKRSQLNDKELARFYELKTNRPLYMEREGNVYSLTYSDANLPTHYGFKIRNKIERIEKAFSKLQNKLTPLKNSEYVSESEVKRIVESLDKQGRWVSIIGTDRLTGQPKIAKGTPILSSKVFSHNIDALSIYLMQNFE